MSDADGDAAKTAAGPRLLPEGGPPPRNGCLTAFMVIFGIILLLPGLCALIFSAGVLNASQPDPVVLRLVLTGLLVGAGGVLLIWAAIRGPRA